MARRKTKKKATRKKATRKKAKKKATRKKATRKAAKKKTTRKKATRKKAKKKATRKKATRKAAKKKTTRKKAKKKTTRKKSKRKPNAAFMKPLTPSKQLSAVVGTKPLPRTEVVKKLWSYIRKKNLQDPKNRRNIRADATLKPIFGGKSVVSMFEMTKHVSKHLK